MIKRQGKRRKSADRKNPAPEEKAFKRAKEKILAEKRIVSEKKRLRSKIDTHDIYA